MSPAGPGGGSRPARWHQLLIAQTSTTHCLGPRPPPTPARPPTPHPPHTLGMPPRHADGSGRVDRAEFRHLLDAIETRAGKPSVTMRKSVHNSE